MCHSERSEESLRETLRFTQGDNSGVPFFCGLIYSGLHLNEERKKVGRNKRNVSGMDARAGKGLRSYPGLRKPVCLLAQMKTAVRNSEKARPAALSMRLDVLHFLKALIESQKIRPITATNITI